MAVIGTERRVLRIVKQLGQANKVQVGERIGISQDYAEYLCKQMVLGGYLAQTSQPSVSRRYTLTPAGEEAAAKTWDQPAHLPVG